MAEQCWEYLNADLTHWAPWCRFFGTSDGLYFVIDADLLDPPAWVSTVIRRPTAVFYCTEDAGVTDLNADFMFKAETTPEDAIAQMGYELVKPREYVATPIPVTNGVLILNPDDSGSTGDSGSTA